MKPARISDRSRQAEISEVFSSLQGEGPYLGVQQIFVRFGRCNMHCHYCDELEKMKEGSFEVVAIEELMARVSALEQEKGVHHSISLTGGEPLFYTPFLKTLLPELKAKGLTTYLETNGTLPRELSEVIRWCDIIAMDWKTASSTQDREFEREHEAFLKVAIQKDVFVKTVITPETSAEEVLRCVESVSAVNPKIPFIFQPLSEAFGISAKALELIEKELIGPAKERLADVRVIPQMHKIWGVR